MSDLALWVIDAALLMNVIVVVRTSARYREQTNQPPISKRRWQLVGLVMGLAVIAGVVVAFWQLRR